MTVSKMPPAWKLNQLKRKSRENRLRIVTGLIFLALVSGLMLVGFLGKKAKDSLWDGKSRLTVVEDFGDDLTVKVLMPEQKRIVEFSFPSQTLVRVPFGYGQYQAGKIFELGNLDGIGGKLLKRSIQDLLAIKMMAYQYNSQTDLSWLDKLQQLRFNWFQAKKTSSYDLSSLNSLELERLSDGEKIYKPVQVLIDELINRELFDQKMIDEGLGIAIANGTDKAGAAQDVSRLVANLGGEVRLITNTAKQKNSKVLVSNKKLLKTRTVENLTQLLEVEEAQVQQLSQYRSEVVMVIGQDYVSLK